MHARGFATCLIALLAGGIVSACGTNSTSGGSSDESDQIAAAIKRAYTSADPSSCSELSTVRSNEQLSGGLTGHGAVAYCERYAADPANDASSVEVSNVKIDGNRATADVLLHGTNLNGSTITQQLVREDGRWKLDLISAIPHFDGTAYRRQFVALGLHNGDITQAQATCLRQALEAASDSQLIAFNTDPKGGTAVFDQLFGHCYF